LPVNQIERNKLKIPQPYNDILQENALKLNENKEISNF
jgi:hypothetical protein